MNISLQLKKHITMINNQDTLSQLPNGWELVSLPLVAYFQEGPGLRKRQFRKEGIPFLNIRTFKEEIIDKSLCQYLDKKEVQEQYSHFLLNEGDIIVSSSGTLGRTAVVRKQDLPLMLNTSVIRFRALKPNILDQGYLRLFLKSPYFYEQIISRCTGTAQLNYGPSHLKEMDIILPPLPEQKRIVAKVEKLLEQVNKTREELAKLPLLIKKFRQSVLAKAFKGELTKQDPKDELASVLLERIKKERQKLLGNKYKEPEPVNTTDLPDLPKGWEWATIDQTGLLNPRHPSNIAPPNRLVSFVPMAAVDADLGVITAPETKPISEVIKGFTHFINGDILFAKITPCMENGKAAIAKGLVNGIGCGTTEFHVIRPLGGLLSDYIYYFVRQETFRRKAKDNMTGTVGQARVPTEFIKSEFIPVPPLLEQKRIVDEIESLFTRADEIAKAIEEAQKHCDRMTQSILAKAFRGELVPQDPSDEPASVLLERIKTLKGGTQKPAKEKHCL